MGITSSVEVARSPADVFAYLDDLGRHGEWQTQIVSVRVDTDGPTRVGSKATEVRKVPGGPREFQYEITEHDPPNRATFRGLNGPLRPGGTVTAAPLDDGSRTRVDIDFDLVPHGIFGYLLKPIAMRDARKHIPKDMQRFKERLESGA